MKKEVEFEVTPKEKKTTGEGVGFERIRRITGYLVGTVDRFNDAKKDTTRVKIIPKIEIMIVVILKLINLFFHMITSINYMKL